MLSTSDDLCLALCLALYLDSDRVNRQLSDLPIRAQPLSYPSATADPLWGEPPRELATRSVQALGRLPTSEQDSGAHPAADPHRYLVHIEARLGPGLGWVWTYVHWLDSLIPVQASSHV